MIIGSISSARPETKPHTHHPRSRTPALHFLLLLAPGIRVWACFNFGRGVPLVFYSFTNPPGRWNKRNTQQGRQRFFTPYTHTHTHCTYTCSSSNFFSFVGVKANSVVLFFLVHTQLRNSRCTHTVQGCVNPTEKWNKQNKRTETPSTRFCSAGRMKVRPPAHHANTQHRLTEDTLACIEATAAMLHPQRDFSGNQLQLSCHLAVEVKDQVFYSHHLLAR